MKAVLDYLTSGEDRFIQELCEYVSLPSVSADPRHRNDIHATAEWIAKHCQQIGLETRLVSTSGNPVVVAKTPLKKSAKKTSYLVYGHYDVQPPDPFELWRTPPFEPRIEGGKIYGRGTSDNKGQHFAHLKAVEAYLRTGTELPCNLTFVIEGEEEIGSTNFAPFLARHRKELRCAAVVISDNALPNLKLPALTYALRGIADMEIIVTGPNRDLHSGLFGGSLENPAMALCQLLAQLRDARGRINIPRFYDDVEPLTRYERAQMARLPFAREAYRKFVGVPELFGERGYSPFEQRSARPTLEINGLTSGYQGEGSKTIVPSWARAKVTMRLVPNQTPKSVTGKIEAFLREKCPDTVRLQINKGNGGMPYRVSPDGSLAQAAMAALRLGFGYEPILFREGGSIPIVNDFKRVLGADSLMLGLSLDEDGPHSPNESFDLAAFSKGMRMSAFLWQELASQKEGINRKHK